MKFFRFAGIAALTWLASLCSALRAEDAPAKTAQGKPIVIVSRMIDGKSVKGPTVGNWARIEVELKAQSDGIKEALTTAGITDAKFNNASVKWVNNVKVTLMVGYQPSSSDLGKPKVLQEVIRLRDAVTAGKSIAEATRANDVHNWRFYKAGATILTLESNMPKSVFFYLPSDIIRRDGITNVRPDAAYVTLEVDGNPIPVLDPAGRPFTGSFAVLFTGNLGAVTKANLDKLTEVAELGARDTIGILRPQNIMTGYVDGDWGRSSPEFVREEALAK